MKEILDKSKIYVTSNFLILVFLIPTIIQSSFLFKNHTHKLCVNTKTHLHKKIEICNLCDFSFSKNDYVLNDLSLLESTNNYKKSYSNYSNLSDLKKFNYFLLRAPPFFLST